jgi:hypothetical protein
MNGRNDLSSTSPDSRPLRALDSCKALSQPSAPMPPGYQDSRPPVGRINGRPWGVLMATYEENLMATQMWVTARCLGRAKSRRTPDADGHSSVSRSSVLGT